MIKLTILVFPDPPFSFTQTAATNLNLMTIFLFLSLAFLLDPIKAKHQVDRCLLLMFFKDNFLPTSLINHNHLKKPWKTLVRLSGKKQ